MTRFSITVLVISMAISGVSLAGQIMVAGPIASSPSVGNPAVCYVSNLANEHRTFRWSYIRLNGEPYEEILDIDIGPYETLRLDTEDLEASLCVMEIEGNVELWRLLSCNLAFVDEGCSNTLEGRIVPGFKFPQMGDDL